MSVKEFDFITLRELYLKIDGYHEGQRQQLESNIYWLRWLATHIYNTAGKSYKKEVEGLDLFRFDWEKNKPIARKVNEEERATLLSWGDQLRKEEEERKAKAKN